MVYTCQLHNHTTLITLPTRCSDNHSRLEGGARLDNVALEWCVTLADESIHPQLQAVKAARIFRQRTHILSCFEVPSHKTTMTTMTTTTYLRYVEATTMHRPRELGTIPVDVYHLCLRIFDHIWTSGWESMTIYGPVGGESMTIYGLLGESPWPYMDHWVRVHDHIWQEEHIYSWLHVDYSTSASSSTEIDETT